MYMYCDNISIYIPYTIAKPVIKRPSLAQTQANS